METTTVLFMCPHNAAKSILAAAYGQQMAAKRQLDWQILTAGTEPDDEPSPAVLALLRAEGLPISEAKPHTVTAAELEAADWIISMGCDLTGLAPAGTAVEYWDDIPAPSQDLYGAKQAIINHLKQFVSLLV